jgi:hypothetical protein
MHAKMQTSTIEKTLNLISQAVNQPETVIPTIKVAGVLLPLTYPKSQAAPQGRWRQPPDHGCPDRPVGAPARARHFLGLGKGERQRLPTAS